MSVRGVSSSTNPVSSLTETGIVCHDLTGFSHITMDLVRQLYRQRLRLVGSGRRPLLLLAQDILTVEFQVQLYASHPDLQRNVTALAIVGNSFMLRHLTSMFLSYHAPDYPVQLFDTRAEAEAWLTGDAQASQDQA